MQKFQKVVCVIGMIIEGTSLGIAIRTVNKERGSMSIAKYVRTCKDPSNFVILFEDSAAEIGLLVAIVGVFLSNVTGNARFDAAASIIIGLLLVVVAILLLRETKGLLIGEGLSPYEIEDIIKIVEKDECVNRCGQVLSMYMGPQDMILTCVLDVFRCFHNICVLKCLSFCSANVCANNQSIADNPRQQ